MTLVACSLTLAAWLSQAWSLQLLAINKNLGTKALPSIAHDLELSCDGLQLARARVGYFYFELFSQVAPYIL